MFGDVKIQRGPARDKSRVTVKFVQDRLARLDEKEKEMGIRIDLIGAERIKLQEVLKEGNLPTE